MFLVGNHNSSFLCQIKFRESSFSAETWAVFRDESFDLGEGLKEEAICLPDIDPQIFLLVWEWVEKGFLHIVDPVPYNPNLEMSMWCRLHVFAKQFQIDELAKECLKNYSPCRQPYWQGGWMPLAVEIEFAYRISTPCL